MTSERHEKAVDAVEEQLQVSQEQREFDAEDRMFSLEGDESDFTRMKKAGILPRGTRFEAWRAEKAVEQVLEQKRARREEERAEGNDTSHRDERAVKAVADLIANRRRPQQ